MPSADFYLIAQDRFREDPLLLACELAKRAFENRIRTLILTRSLEQAEILDEKLWEFEEQAFVPHQLAGDADDDDVPVLIVPPGTAVKDRPLVINLREECVNGAIETVKEIVPADPAERENSRLRWKTYQARGYAVRKFDM